MQKTVLVEDPDAVAQADNISLDQRGVRHSLLGVPAAGAGILTRIIVSKGTVRSRVTTRPAVVDFLLSLAIPRDLRSILKVHGGQRFVHGGQASSCGSVLSFGYEI